MPRDRDPVAAHSDDGVDLYEVTEWEPRTALDRIALWLHAGLITGARLFVVLAAAAILLVQLLLGGLGVLADPVLGLFVLFSAVPALLLAAYVWYADVTTSEPLSLLVITFLLGVLFAGFAGVLNSLVGGPIQSAAASVGAAPIVGSALFFFLVVGPIEETVKLLAVRLSPYRDERFNAVVDGAVYGAVAGLGFATIENALYISQQVDAAGAEAVFQAAGGTAILRSLVGPGHVLYSALAGYYLGLAKFNPEDAGPIVVKGLLVAAVVHATYNTLAGIAPAAIAEATGLGLLGGFLAFVVVYDGLIVAVLLRKLSSYRAAYRDADVGQSDYESELAEFDP
jgi:RsiW-degrading membrane proteinase PrsW (M82 family)